MNNFASVRRYPTTRLRRNRAQASIRDLVREHELTPRDLIWPLFLSPTDTTSIAAMPGVQRLSLDDTLAAAAHAVELGIPAVALFPATDPSDKDAVGTEASNPDNLTCRAVRAVRARHPELMVICDVALDPYTDHGHDGVFLASAHAERLRATQPELADAVDQGGVDNDASIERLIAQALCLAEAGCRALAPSDMMDGRIGALRAALDGAGFHDCLLISYAAKYASKLYGPFREAIGSSGALRGDKKQYQMDPGNRAEAMHEIGLDIAEGADMVMVKPGIFYLDVIADAQRNFGVPVLAYQVSGEYAMIAHAPNADAIMMEALLCFKRAGASGMFTYFAPTAAKLLR